MAPSPESRPSLSFSLIVQPVTAGGHWQAELRGVDGASVAVFTSPLDLLRYLVAAADPRPSPGGVR